MEPVLDKIWTFVMHINILTSSTQHQTALFHVVERTRTFVNRTKMKNALAKCAKLLFLIVKSADL